MNIEPGALHGRTEHRYESEGLAIAETVYSGVVAIPSHEHPNALLCLIIDGRSEQTCARRTWIDKSSTVTIFPAGLPHSNNWNDSGGRVMHLQFAPQWLKGLPT